MQLPLHEINNISCYFKSTNIIIKMKLLMSYCSSSHYRAELWLISDLQTIFVLQNNGKYYVNYWTNWRAENLQVYR